MNNSLIELKSIDLTQNGLLDYKNWLNEISTSNSTTPIFNDGKERAALLMSQIFRSATDHVYIYSRCMNPELTSIDVYYYSLQECLNRGVQISVLLQEDKPSDSRILIEAAKNGSIKVLSPEQQKILQTSLDGNNYHFTVADSKIFRLEYDVKDFKAIASFNGEKIAKDLEETFSLINSN